MNHPLYSPLTVWALLAVGTGLTYSLGEFGAPGTGLIVGVLALAVFKGRLVVLDFMELRQAPPLWRRVVMGWLLLVVTGIIFAYLKGTP